jgi:hypothetical protein
LMKGSILLVKACLWVVIFVSRAEDLNNIRSCEN